MDCDVWMADVASPIIAPGPRTEYLGFSTRYPNAPNVLSKRSLAPVTATAKFPISPPIGGFGRVALTKELLPCQQKSWQPRHAPKMTRQPANRPAGRGVG